MPVRIIHFHNGSGGGVLSVIRNLLLYRQHSEIENHVIYTINKDQIQQFQVPGLVGAASEQIFYYSSTWNFYYTCRQLSKLLPDEQAVLIAHDWLELGMVSNLGLQNPVIQFLHGNYEYYYNLSVTHKHAIDAFVCVASSINEKLKHLLPQRKETIFYQRFPVPDVQTKSIEGGVRKIVFIGRCEESKGYNLLPAIAEQLINRGKDFEWHIFGEGSLVKEKQRIWPATASVFFYGITPNEKMLELMPSFDCLILPSIAEGMPLTVIEAMKAGLIPVVNDLPGGLQEIIINGKTGYRVENNSVNAYAKTLAGLQENEIIANEIASFASHCARDWFNPVTNTSAMEAVFLGFTGGTKKKPKQEIYTSRLDKNWMPNIITKSFRAIANMKWIK